MKIYVDVEGFNEFIQDVTQYTDKITPIAMFECMVEDIDVIAAVVYKYLTGDHPDYAPSRLFSYLAEQAADNLNRDQLDYLATCCRNIIHPTIMAIFNVIDFYNYEFDFIRHEFGSDDDGTALLVVQANKDGCIPSIDDEGLSELATKALSVMCGKI